MGALLQLTALPAACMLIAWMRAGSAQAAPHPAVLHAFANVGTASRVQRSPRIRSLRAGSCRLAV